MDAEPYRVYLRGELGKNGPQDRVTRVVDEMADRDVVWLTNTLSRIRNNSVARTLAKCSTWEQEPAPISRVTVNDAEEELKDAFGRLEHRLVAIAADPEVMRHPRYACHQSGEPVQYPVLVARRDGQTGYRVFDGIHRAIQLARNREDTLDLCVVGVIAAG